MNEGARGFRQLGILLHRDADLFFKDSKKIGFTFLLPLVVAIIIAAVASDKTGTQFEATQSTLFTIISAAIYFGMFNSLTLICKERKIIKREYMTGMSLMAYVTSNVLFQAVITLLQSAVFMAVYLIGLDLPTDSPILLPSAILEYYIGLFLVMFAADMMGMVVSSAVRNNEIANLLAPLIIIFQLVMGGVLFELSGLMKKVSFLTVSKWGLEAMGSVAGLTDMQTRLGGELKDEKYDAIRETMEDLSAVPDRFIDAYETTTGHLLFTWFILTLFVILLTAACFVLLKRVEKDER